LVLQNLGASLDWGVLTAASRELPLLYGAREFQRASDYRKTALYLHLIGKILAAFGIIIYEFYHYPVYHAEFAIVIAAAVIIVISSIGEAGILFYQASQNYVALSKRLFFYWTFYGLALILGAWFGGVPGMIAAFITALLLQILLLRAGMKYKSEGRLNFSLTSSILSFSLPFKAADFPMSIAGILDSLFVSRFLGLKALAIYATAKLIFNQAGQIPTWAGNVFIMRMTTLMGKGNQRERLGNEMLHNLSIINLIVLPLIISTISLISYWGVTMYLPAYAASLPMVPILLMSLYFQPRVTVIRNFWIVEKKFKWLTISNLLGIAAMSGGFILLIQMNQISLMSVAIVFTTSFALYYFFVIARLGVELWGVKKWIVFNIEVILALFMLIFACWNADLLVPVQPEVVTIKIIMRSCLIFYSAVFLIMLYGFYKLASIGYMDAFGSWNLRRKQIVKNKV